MLAPVGTGGLSFAVNTNWDVFVDHGTWYLLEQRALARRTRRDRALPAGDDAAGRFRRDPERCRLRRGPQKHPAAAAGLGGRCRRIFVSTKPAEIIVTDGAAANSCRSPGTGLQSVKNTASALFFDPATALLLLLSGRWFAATGLDGPWTFATDELPPDFALIPPGEPGRRGARLRARHRGCRRRQC